MDKIRSSVLNIQNDFQMFYLPARYCLAFHVFICNVYQKFGRFYKQNSKIKTRELFIWITTFIDWKWAWKGKYIGKQFLERGNYAQKEKIYPNGNVHTTSTISQFCYNSQIISFLPNSLLFEKNDWTDHILRDGKRGNRDSGFSAGPRLMSHLERCDRSSHSSQKARSWEENWWSVSYNRIGK